MGNTFSIASNILFFTHPLDESRTRLKYLLAKKPKTFSDQKRTNPEIPRRLQDIPPSSSKHLTIQIFEVSPLHYKRADVDRLLRTLCKELRADLDGWEVDARGPGTNIDADELLKRNEGLKPRIIFYVRGDFGNSIWNGMCSVMFGKLEEESSIQMPMPKPKILAPLSRTTSFTSSKTEEDYDSTPHNSLLMPMKLTASGSPPPFSSSPPSRPTSSNRRLSSLSGFSSPRTSMSIHDSRPGSIMDIEDPKYLHIFEPDVIAGHVGQTLQELEKSRAISKMTIKADEMALSVIELAATFWANSRWADTGKEEQEKMTEMMEDQLGTIWRAKRRNGFG